MILTLIIFLNNNQVAVKASSGPRQNAFLQKRGGLLSNNTVYGFQILYPQDWRVIEGDSANADKQNNRFER
jgi:hypothetical protein